ncbi:MAG: M64 family metallopeptidase [archaeon]
MKIKKLSVILIFLALLVILTGCMEFPIGGTSKAPPKNQSIQCQDNIDNDSDGFCDYRGCTIGKGKDRQALPMDPDCTGSNDNSEFCRDSIEICNGLDDNCNGQTDENACNITYYCDSDRDGYFSSTADGVCYSFNCAPAGCQTTAGNDCDDNAADMNPGAAENCTDNKDNDCDGIVDECDTCANGVLDGSETDIDCGGTCALCDEGKNCDTNSDCLTLNCTQNTCTQSSFSLDPLCKPLKFDGSFDSRITIIFVPSNFNGDMENFRQKAEWVTSVFNNYDPLKSTNSRLNVMYVPEEKGSYCYFNCGGIARLLCCNGDLAVGTSSRCTEGPRQTVVIHNDETYGGAGSFWGGLSTTSVHPSAPRIAVHELGHSLFGLGDEYNYQGHSSPLNSPNCDYAGCSKWAELLGVNGVNCKANSCGNGAYYTSENTIMYSLSYNFEEINLRSTCCTYARETGIYPQYCSQFSNLDSYCGITLQSPSAGAVPFVQPFEYRFIKTAEGAWKLESITPKRAGSYANKIAGVGAKYSSTLKIVRANGKQEIINIASEEDMEFPGENDSLGGYLKMPLTSFSIIIEHLKGPVKDLEIDGKPVKKKE